MSRGTHPVASPLRCLSTHRSGKSTTYQLSVGSFYWLIDLLSHFEWPPRGPAYRVQFGEWLSDSCLNGEWLLGSGVHILGLEGCVRNGWMWWRGGAFFSVFCSINMHRVDGLMYGILTYLLLCSHPTFFSRHFFCSFCLFLLFFSFLSCILPFVPLSVSLKTYYFCPTESVGMRTQRSRRASGESWKDTVRVTTMKMSLWKSSVCWRFWWARYARLLHIHFHPLWWLRNDSSHFLANHMFPNASVCESKLYFFMSTAAVKIPHPGHWITMPKYVLCTVRNLLLLI